MRKTLLVALVLTLAVLVSADRVAAICQAGGDCNGNNRLNWIAPTTNTDGTPLTDFAGFEVIFNPAPGACTATTAVIDAYEAGVVITRRDLDGLANLLTEVMWDGSLTSPRFSNSVDGGNAPYKGYGAWNNGAIVKSCGLREIRRRPSSLASSVARTALRPRIARRPARAARARPRPHCASALRLPAAA